MRRSALLGLCFVVAATAAPTAGRGQSLSACPEGVDGLGVYIRGEVERPQLLTAEDFENMPRQRISMEERNGATVEYEGVALGDILAHAGVPMESLRGPQAATVVVAEARDGYRAVFALAELDESFSDRLVLLVDRKNGAALAADEGPFRVVMRGERRHSRWIRQVTCLRVVRP